MRKNLIPVFAVAIGLLIVSRPAFAHHGAAGYDMTKIVTLTGTVTKYDWSNPHILVYADAKDPNGTMQHWSLELAAPLLMDASRLDEKLHQVGRPSGGRDSSCQEWRTDRDRWDRYLPPEVRGQRYAAPPPLKLRVDRSLAYWQRRSVTMRNRLVDAIRSLAIPATLFLGSPLLLAQTSEVPNAAHSSTSAQQAAPWRPDCRSGVRPLRHLGHNNRPTELGPQRPPRQEAGSTSHDAVGSGKIPHGQACLWSQPNVRQPK